MNPPVPERLPVVTDEDRENLSAYLDGELGEDATEALIAKVSRSDNLRTTAEEMQKTWELLDYLPRPQAPENFTEKTLHKLDTTKIVLLTREKRWKRLAVFGWAFTLLLACGFGFFLAFYWPREQPPAQTVLPETSTELQGDSSKEVPDAIDFPGYFRLQRIQPHVTWNVRRILSELRNKMTREERTRLVEAASKGTWEYLDELRKLAIVHKISLDEPSPPPKQRSPGEERPKPKNTAKKGQE